jgi:hypothetical protein
MSNDERDILQVLEAELDFIEKGGYGRSVRTPWKPQSAFEDSLSCINYADVQKSHSCDECGLIDFVPADHLTEKVPCHFIPLNTAGETVGELEETDDQEKLETELKKWLRARIQEVKSARLAAAQLAEFRDGRRVLL